MPDDLYDSTSVLERQNFQTELDNLMQSLEDDPWNGYLGSIRAGGEGIIGDQEGKVQLYLRTIEMLWQLGVKLI